MRIIRFYKLLKIKGILPKNIENLKFTSLKQVFLNFGINKALGVSATGQQWTKSSKQTGLRTTRIKCGKLTIFLLIEEEDCTPTPLIH